MPNVVPFRLKLNNLAGKDRPVFRSNSFEWRAGMRPSAFQLETAETRTPASLAAALFPPTKLTRSPTVMLIHAIKFRNLEKSRVQNSGIDNSQALKWSASGDGDMADRDELMARVRQLPEILGKRDGELSELCRVTPQQWSNYKAEGANNIEFPWRCALILWQAYGIPMEWLYDGETSRATDPVLRERLTKANQKAQAWLETRRPRRSPKSGIARIGLLMVAGAFFLTTGVTHGHAWKRADGHPMVFESFTADRMTCYQITGVTNARNGITEGQRLAFYACMADQGYSIGE